METIEFILQKLKHITINQTQTPFNALNLMYREVLRKEELQSKIIGGFLNPNENHGFGYVPLTLFLDTIFGEDKIKISQNSKFSVDLERSVTPIGIPPRRIDILLSWIGNDNKKHAVIIENKLNWASNQTNQLNDYYDCLFAEKYVIEGVVYMPFSSKHQHSKHTDTRPDVLALTKDFDAKQLVDWLAKIEIFLTLNEETDLSSIVQYKEFLECLINNKYTTMKAIEIINDLSIEEINKLENLAKIISTNEWCEAIFTKISLKINNYFNGNLETSYKKWSDGRNYVQYYFNSYEFWVELWLDKNEIELYIVTKNNNGETISIGTSIFKYSSYDINYYYQHDLFFKFDYNDIDKITEKVVPILKELEKYDGSLNQGLN